MQSPQLPPFEHSQNPMDQEDIENQGGFSPIKFEIPQVKIADDFAIKKIPRVSSIGSDLPLIMQQNSRQTLRHCTTLNACRLSKNETLHDSSGEVTLDESGSAPNCCEKASRCSADNCFNQPNRTCNNKVGDFVGCGSNVC